MAGKHATLQIEDGRTNPAFSCPHVKFKFTAFQVECMSPDRIDNNTQQHTTASPSKTTWQGPRRPWM
jgi:hypothetical protein